MGNDTPGVSPFELDGRSVHIYAVHLDAPEAVAAQFYALLAHDERERAARFRFDRLRYSYTVTRGALRILLGRYLGADPAGIGFLYGSKGKPRLDPPAPIEFNVSHSGTLAVYAFTKVRELGVDVEQIRPLADMQGVAARFFCAEESAELMALPSASRTQAFFLCWTRKEAYLKAIGDGLSVPLDGFRVTLRPGEPASMVHLAQDAAAAAAWTLHDLSLAPEYAAALAYRDVPRPLVVFPPIEPAELLRGN
jgi:4'-phosphopantetheinyl transferase